MALITDFNFQKFIFVRCIATEKMAGIYLKKGLLLPEIWHTLVPVDIAGVNITTMTLSFMLWPI